MKNGWSRWLVGVVIVATVLWSVLPILWMVSISIRTPEEAFLPTIWPKAPTILTYLHGFAQFRTYFINSLVVSGWATVISLTLGSLAAFGFSRFRLRGGGAALSIILSNRLFPPVLLAIAFFMMIQQVHLYDTLTAVVLMDSLHTLPFAVWMLKNYFDSIPKELDEAAVIDGCGMLGVLGRVVIPLSLPGFMATAVYCFLLSWNELLYGMTFVLSKDKQVVTVAMAQLVGEWWTNYPEMMALSVLFSLPIIIGFIAVQRYLVQGLTAGAVKS